MSNLPVSKTDGLSNRHGSLFIHEKFPCIQLQLVFKYKYAKVLLSKYSVSEWGIYSAFIITTFDNKESGILCIRKFGENVIWQQLEIFLRLFTSSLLSQDLVNIEGIVPLKRICESAKHSYIINPPAKNRSLMNLTSLEIKNRSLEFPVSWSLN